jgi:hypothetical protein
MKDYGFGRAHELGHSFGAVHPGTDDANTQAAYDTYIWMSCFK